MGIARDASSSSNRKEEPQPSIAPFRLSAVTAINTPPQEAVPVPTPKEVSPAMVTIDPKKTYTRKTGIVDYEGKKLNCDRYPNAWGCCLEVMKAAGLLPNGTVTKNGFAGSIPTEPLKLEEGEKTVIVTSEGSVGHTLEVEKKDGKYLVTKEGGYGRDRVGEEVSEAVIKGKAKLAVITKSEGSPKKEKTEKN